MSDPRSVLPVVGVGAISTPERREGRNRNPHRGNAVMNWPAVVPFPSADGRVHDPFTHSDPWKGYASQRSHAVHSGMSPKLERERESLDAFLADIDSTSLPPIPIPTPAVANDSNSVLQALLEGQSALIQGDNELRANAVTKEHLRTFQNLQAQAMHTYVQAELTPVHASINELSSQVGAFTDRINQGSLSRGEPVKDGSDPAYNQIAFLNFPAQSSVYERLTAMKRFMETNFPKVTPVCTNLFSDKNGDPSVNGFVQVVDSKCVKRIIDEITSKNLTFGDFKDVKIKRAKAAVDRNRDWALYRAEELIKTHSAAVGKAVVRERGSDSRVRGVYVDGVRAFEQSSRFCKDGVFLKAFAALSLR